jgi:UDP-3-O-[3-hydroxymyristoyl] N-acetylglucosamine deacetylase
MATAGAGHRQRHVEIDGPEVPVMDGSADRSSTPSTGGHRALRQAALCEGAEPVASNSASPLPSSAYDGSRIEVEIDFANPLIGRQSIASTSPDSFRKGSRVPALSGSCATSSSSGRGLCLGAARAVVLGEIG